MKPVYQRTDAVNCFASGLAHSLADQSGKPVTEASIMLLGGGFQFQASFDEYDYPEYIVEVIPACRRAMDLLNVKLLNRCLLRGEVLFEDLPHLIEHYKQVFVWVNSRFMDYSETYSKREGYIHAIVLEGYDAHERQFRIFDPLIVDRVPVACHTTLDADTLLASMTTVVQGNELAPEMGQVFYVENASALTIPQDSKSFLRSQAQANLNEPKHRDALLNYHQTCMEALKSTRASRAARRLFDQISPLSVLPTIFHLKGLVGQIGCSAETQTALLETESLWKQLAILALKFEATLEAELMQRIDQKFVSVERVQSTFWNRVLHDLQEDMSNA